MSEHFDPYHRWLGIHPKHQPADHYRLLGIERFESDPEVIHDAAERQIAHVRRYALGQHEQVMGKSLSRFPGDPQRPVETVAWRDAGEFCRRLSVKEGQTYRLPTEAEWEYACRAGSASKWFFGDDESALKDYGWFAGNADKMTHPVAQKKPNAWGLQDMLGNVGEWCADWYIDNYSRWSPPKRIRGARRQGRTGCTGVAVGGTKRLAAGHRPATGTTRASASMSWASGSRERPCVMPSPKAPRRSGARRAGRAPNPPLRAVTGDATSGGVPWTRHVRRVKGLAGDAPRA